MGSDFYTFYNYKGHKNVFNMIIDSELFHCQVTTPGKLFTYTCK